MPNVRIFPYSIYCSWHFNLCPLSHFLFLTRIVKLHKQVIKADWTKAEHPFVDKVFTYYSQTSERLKKHSIIWSSWKIVQSIFCKNPVHKTYFNVSFKPQSLFITRNILIQRTCLTSLTYFLIYFSDNTTIYNKLLLKETRNS